MPAASSIYWNSEDSQRSSSGDGSEPTSSLSTSGGAAVETRRYIDPWDLENYAYLRRRQQLIVMTSKNEDPVQLPRYLSPENNESSTSDSSYYWCPENAGVVKEPGYDPVTAIEKLYLGPTTPSRNVNRANNETHTQSSNSNEDDARYVTPNPVYVPLSDLAEYSEDGSDHPGLKLLPRRRNRSIKNILYPKDENACPYHGPLAEIAISKEAEKKSQKQLGLNTYGHLRIDYAKSWNSLHRKMKK